MVEAILTRGWNRGQSAQVARLYEEAFGPKFSKAISDKQTRIDILSQSFVPDYSYVAVVNGDIVGIAGFQTQNGSLNGRMNLRGLIAELGILKGIWAGFVFSLLERRSEPRELEMDGIAVNSGFRSRGIGSSLLDQIIRHVKEHGFQTVRLDVIDTNPEAKKLYESKGFIARNKKHFPCLEWLFGFSGSTTIIFNVR